MLSPKACFLLPRKLGRLLMKRGRASTRQTTSLQRLASRTQDDRHGPATLSCAHDPVIDLAFLRILAYKLLGAVAVEWIRREAVVPRNDIRIQAQDLPPIGS